MDTQTLATSILEAIDRGIFIIESPHANPDPTIEFVNEGLVELTGYDDETIVGQPPDFLVEEEVSGWLETIENSVRGGESFQNTYSTKRRDQSPIDCGWKITRVVNPSDEEERYWVFSLNEFPNQKSREELERLAHYDPLTDLPNRNLFFDRLEQSIKRADRRDQSLSVIFLDLDRFKAINDTLGHEVGDELLKKVARRLEDTLRASDTVARLGGDEFTVLLPETETEQNPRTVAQKIFQAFRDPFEVGGNEVSLTTSMGIALFPEHGNDSETLIQKADGAMYQAKEEGGNSYHIFLDEQGMSGGPEFSLEEDLRNALERDQMDIALQPEYDLRANKLTGLEALLRWNHPKRGTIRPPSFVPLAEMTGLIVPLERWVLKRCCEILNDWSDGVVFDGYVSTNISSQQFRRADMIESIMELINDHNLSPDRFTVEISEPVAMHDVEHSISVMRRLKELGFGLCLDDFGTGHSSLKYLQRFPIDSIKIGEKVIDKIPHRQDTLDLVKSISQLVDNLDASLIAEGVENEEQLDVLQEHDINVIQGHFVAKAQSPGSLKSEIDNEAELV